MLHQALLARAVAAVHRPQLGNGLVALVDEHQRILGKVVQQGRRRLPRLAAGEVPGVVLNAVAVAELAHHFHVEPCALGQALCLQELAKLSKFLRAHFEFLGDGAQRTQLPLSGHHVVAGGIDRNALVGLQDLTQKRVDLRERVDLVAPKLDAVGVVVIGGEDLDRVAHHAEHAALQRRSVAPLVEHLDQLSRYRLARLDVAPLEHQQHSVVGVRGAEAVDAAHAGDDQAVPPLEEGLRRREAQLVEVVVDGGLLLDVGVAGWHVSFRLVVVVVAHEVLDGVPGEEALELVVELGSQGLVVREHERRALRRLDHLGHGVRLPRPRDAQQDLVGLAVLQALDELGDGRRLVAARRVVGCQMEAHHGPV